MKQLAFLDLAGNPVGLLRRGFIVFLKGKKNRRGLAAPLAGKRRFVFFPALPLQTLPAKTSLKIFIFF